MPYRIALFVLALLALSACDSTEDSVAGTYTATSFTLDGVDVLSQGVSLRMTLTEDGRVTGQFTVPDDLNEPGEPSSYSLAGTYVVSGSRVTFTQEADTFVRDARWTYSDGELRGAQGEIAVVMRR